MRGARAEAHAEIGRAGRQCGVTRRCRGAERDGKRRHATQLPHQVEAAVRQDTEHLARFGGAAALPIAQREPAERAVLYSATAARR